MVGNELVDGIVGTGVVSTSGIRRYLCTVLADGLQYVLPVGHDVVPTDQDVEAANRVAEGIAQCIKYAQGDPVVFTNELQRITVDNMPAMLRQAKR